VISLNLIALTVPQDGELGIVSTPSAITFMFSL
jgi:hypothetical protein